MPTDREPRVPLPPGWSVKGLPKEMVNRFKDAAKEVINTQFVPAIWLRFARRARRAKESKAADFDHFFKVCLRSGLLGSFEKPLIRSLFERTKTKTFDSGEVVVYKGEPPTAVTILSKGALVSRSSSDGEPLKAPSAVVDYGLLAEEPMTTTLTAAPANVDCNTPGGAEIFSISASDFLQFLDALPPNSAARSAVNSATLDYRRLHMPTSFPITAALLRESQLLVALTDAELSLLSSVAVPRVFDVGATVTEKDRLVDEMLFVRRGTVVTATSSEPQIVIADREMMFRERSKVQFTATTVVDLYSLNRRDLETACADNPAVLASLHTATSRNREEELLSRRTLGQQDLVLTGHIESLPFLKAECQGKPNELHNVVSELRNSMLPKVINRNQVIVSKTDSCDRLFLLSRGVAVVRGSESGFQGPVHFHLGEWIGFTCLLQHRWQHTIVAVEPCDLWELSREVFTAILTKHRLYRGFTTSVQQLVHPMVRIKGLSNPFARCIPNPNTIVCLKTLNMHPTSDAVDAAEFTIVRLPSKTKSLEENVLEEKLGATQSNRQSVAAVEKENHRPASSLRRRKQQLEQERAEEELEMQQEQEARSKYRMSIKIPSRPHSGPIHSARSAQQQQKAASASSSSARTQRTPAPPTTTRSKGEPPADQEAPVGERLFALGAQRQKALQDQRVREVEEGREREVQLSARSLTRQTLEGRSRHRIQMVGVQSSLLGQVRAGSAARNDRPRLWHAGIGAYGSHNKIM